MTENKNLVFWSKFEKFVRNSIPDYIVKVLIETGFDNAISISELNNDDIKIIEEFVETNLKHIVEKSGIYDLKEKFVFLPGHRKLILSLPKRLEEFENNKKKRKGKSETEQENVTTEEIELLTESEINDLKDKLLSKLTKSAKNYGLKEFTEEEVHSSIDVYINHSLVPKNKTHQKPSYKCLIKCIECEKEIPCTWNGYWQIGNLDKHLKNHMKNTVAQDAENQNNSSENHNKNSNEKELNQVLEIQES